MVAKVARQTGLVSKRERQMMIIFLWFLCGALTVAYDIQYDLKKGEDYTANKIGSSLFMFCCGPILGLIYIVLSINNSRRILIRSKAQDKAHKDKSKSKDTSLKDNSLDD